MRRFDPLAIATSLYQHRFLVGQLVIRDVLLRYRGAYFGVAWVLFNPLVTLGAFSFVFGYVVPVRWFDQSHGLPFVLNLYVGLIVFNVFAESLARAPMAVRGQRNFVKKVIFPVEVLPVVPMGAALVQAVANLVILVVALASMGMLAPGVLLLPVVLAPAILLAMGASWFVAAWGVFIKDVAQVVPVATQLLFFLSPVLYPVDVVPAAVRPLYAANPVAATIDCARAVASGGAVDWNGWLIALAVGLVVLVLGYAFFQHTRDEFADVL